MLAASVSFITPFEPSCILVYGPGKYSFRDFVKTGAPLTAILTVIVLLLLPVFWPLNGPARMVGDATTNTVESIVVPSSVSEPVPAKP